MTAPRRVTSVAAVADAVDRMRASAPPSTRLLVGLVGAPGAGKSTVASQLAARLEAPVVPMDGFHLPQSVLRERGLRDRMGAPDTFDVDGFVGLLQALRRAPGDIDAARRTGPSASTGRTVLAPAFDRSVEEPVADAISVPAAATTVIVEGNYLLSDVHGWGRVRALLDLTVAVELDDGVRRERLIARHVAGGKSLEAATAWVDGPDEANARLVAATLARADVVLRR